MHSAHSSPVLPFVSVPACLCTRNLCNVHFSRVSLLASHRVESQNVSTRAWSFSSHLVTRDKWVRMRREIHECTMSTEACAEYFFPLPFIVRSIKKWDKKCGVQRFWVSCELTIIAQNIHAYKKKYVRYYTVHDDQTAIPIKWKTRRCDNSEQDNFVGALTNEKINIGYDSIGGRGHIISMSRGLWHQSAHRPMRHRTENITF